MRVYKQKNVLNAARERIAWIFDRHERVVVSVSSGKDSTVVAHLAAAEAGRRNRTVDLFFLDQEAEYNATIVQLRKMFAWPHVRSLWYQLQIRMTNATGYKESFLVAWEEGKEWIRPKETNSIHRAENYPDRFYPFFRWFEEQCAGAASLIGLRGEEPNRYNAVTRHPAVPGVNWSSRGHGVTKYYPIYDWTFEDVWLYIYREQVPYNKVYDWLWIKEKRINDFRISNLIHENSFECLTLLQEFEPETYNALTRRLGGVAVAARYAKESTVYQTHKLPKAFSSWLTYRNFLLTAVPQEIAEVFSERFEQQKHTEATHRQQVRQILTNDWENNRPISQQDDKDPLRKWREIL